MASAEEFFPQSPCCDICGGALGDEVMIQEFADGSLARLCQECAAGADLKEKTPAVQSASAIVWPALPPEAVPAAGSVDDPLEKTRELLMPVSDLITLQGEMQAALERLAASLERFALEMITESQGRSAVQSRVQELERELEKTRAQLQEAEATLGATVKSGEYAPAQTPAAPAIDLPTVSPPAAPAPAEPAQPPVAMTPIVPLVAPPGVAPADAAPAAERVTPPAAPDTTPVERRSGRERRSTSEKDEMPNTIERRRAPERRKSAKAPKPEPVAQTTGSFGLVARGLVRPGGTGQAAGPYASAQALVAAAGEIRSDNVPTFRIEEVQAAQRYYNECPFVGRVRDVRRSLGKPKANLTRCPTQEPLAIATIQWDIVWYQYLIDMRRDLPLSADRVTLYREGMDLDELAFHFRDKNSIVNDDGKLDASELEVRLLGDPSALITEMTSEETQLLDDLTEETWGSRVAPEFKWDD